MTSRQEGENFLKQPKHILQRKSLINFAISKCEILAQTKGIISKFKSHIVGEDICNEYN
jgi:hypothetical protein